MTSYRHICISLFYLLFTYISLAQTTPFTHPRSFHMSARLFATPAEQVFPFDVDHAKDIDTRRDKAGHMPFFAHSIATDITFTNAGTWTSLADGSRIWRLQISSPGALALIPCFDQFYLPIGATMHIYDPAKEEIIGAFTAANNPKDGRYNTGLIHGDVCIIEYYEPAAAAGQGLIHLNELGHAYRMVPARKESQSGIGFGGSEGCEVNVPCPEGTNWQDQKNAVVRVLVKEGPNYGWCSGSLINNANQDCTPFILSADHCYQDDITGEISTASDLSQWMFYFQYESPTCSNPASEGALANKFMTGATFCAASLDTGGTSGSDFVLLKLNSVPPTSYVPYYAGWSNINTASPNGVGIHHPSADIKKISTYTTALQSVSWGALVANTHWQILWATTTSGHGVTEPGSSGSPVFDPNKRIVGTLTGGGSDCATPNNNDFYGKFSFHWASNGSTSNKRLQNWLDPFNTGIQTMDGAYGPCGATSVLDAAILSVEQASAFCSSTISPVFTLVNYGSNTLTSDSIIYVIDGGAPQLMLWTGSIVSFGSAQVTLPAQSLSAGTHTLTVTSSSPNGGTDANAANNTMSGTFNVVSLTGQYSFFLQTGDQGGAIAWELTDAQSDVIYSGGTYSNNAAGQAINQTWCLPAGCYTLTVFSGNNDGLSGTSLAGTFNVKDNSGNIIAQMQQVDFGAQESVSVCQGIGLGITESIPLANINIYPNPSTGIFNITNVETAAALTVTDALGRLIMSSQIKGQHTMQADLSREESGIYFFKLSSEEGSVVRKVILSAGK